MMDESWKMRKEMPSLPTLISKQPAPSRRSTGDVSSRRRNPISDDDPKDFTDVFGGPPHRVISRHFSLPRSSSSCFYQDIFQQPEKPAAAAVRPGRSLPVFRIPGQLRPRDIHVLNNHRIFGCDVDEGMRSSRSKDSRPWSDPTDSPIWPAISGEDNIADISLFASKQRGVNTKSRWNWWRRGKNDYNHQRQEKTSGMSPINIINKTRDEEEEEENGYSRRSSDKYFMRKNASASDTTMSRHVTNGSFIVCDDDRSDHVVVENGEEIVIRQDVMDEDCYVMEFEINSSSDNKEWTTSASESNGVDEAIAWAKEQYFQAYSSDTTKSNIATQPKPPQEIESAHQISQGHTDSFEFQVGRNAWLAETERQILDEKIRLWSTGKENNIRLLLTSLHHILWANSGWSEVPLANIMEEWQVKKAYQKARLCLHPDKLQQRAATLQQKYIAQRVFSLLQDAWAAFI